MGRPLLMTAALAVFLSGCAGTVTRPEGPAAGAPDPGRIASARTEVSIEGLRPCSDTAANTLTLDPRLPVNVLVHGCQGSAGRFRTLADVLAFHGQQSVCFAYDDRDSLMRSSAQLARAVEQLAPVLDAPSITLIGHSQGGLVARKALIQERDGALQGEKLDLRLVTVSAPFAGIAAASPCGNPLLRIATLGLHDIACWAVSGSKWFEITHASDFIRSPGQLAPQVRSHLKIVTDEQGSCRRTDPQGRCLEDDYVFSLEEQRLAGVSDTTRTTGVEVRAGHVEIVGEGGTAPRKLIAVLQEQGIVPPTPREARSAFQALLARLYSE